MWKQSVWTGLAFVATIGLVTSAHAASPGEAKIRAALDEKTECEFIETPLRDVMDYLEDLHGIPIVVDRVALEDVGISNDVPITRVLRAVSLRSALNITLRELDLTWTISDEVLLITTPEMGEKRATPRVFDISPLLEYAEGEALAEQIEGVVGTSRVGEKPTRRYFVIGDKLVVRAPTPELYRVEALLNELTGKVEAPKVEERKSGKAKRSPMPEGNQDPFGESSEPLDDPFSGGDPFGGAPASSEDSFSLPADANPFGDADPMPFGADPFSE